MERPVVFPWFPFLLFMWLSAASAQNEPVYTAVNGIINLKPDSSGPFANILWKHNGDLVAEWWNHEMDYYGKFVGRATLDTTTGGLVIKDTNENFTGLYTVALNYQLQSKGYEVVFIKEVTKPEVDVRPLACNSERETCIMVCYHYGTSAFGPLTYSWREDDGQWRQGDREMPINNDVSTKGVKTFSCRVENPVSETASDPHKNPFFIEKSFWSRLFQ